MILFLDNIRSAYNVGSIIRSANCFGVKYIILGGITPGPDNKKVTKTSLEAEKNIKFIIAPDPMIYLKKKRDSGYRLISLEINDKSIPLKIDSSLTHRLILIIGNEVSGISKDILNLSDQIFHIPMIGSKESLNVSVACGIALYEFSKIM